MQSAVTAGVELVSMTEVLSNQALPETASIQSWRDTQCMHSTLPQCRAMGYRTVRFYNQAVLLPPKVTLLVILVTSVRLPTISWSVSYQTIAEPHAHVEEDHDGEGWVQ